MNVREYATAHNITTAKANQLARTGKVTARHIGFGALAYWDIIEPGEAFAPLNVWVTSKGIGAYWVLTVHQDDNGFTITSDNATTTECEGSTLRFATADDAHRKYTSYTFDPTRSAYIDPLTA